MIVSKRLAKLNDDVDIIIVVSILSRRSSTSGGVSNQKQLSAESDSDENSHVRKLFGAHFGKNKEKINQETFFPQKKNSS